MYLGVLVNSLDTYFSVLPNIHCIYTWAAALSMPLGNLSGIGQERLTVSFIMSLHIMNDRHTHAFDLEGGCCAARTVTCGCSIRVDP